MDYSYFLHTKTAGKWQTTGVKRRAGIAVPLFSVYSASSVCIGEIPDLKLLVDWCIKTGMSIIQLLPINDVGGDFAPYSSLSTFALDPMYIAIRKLKNADTSPYENDLSKLRKKYRPLFGRVNYNIKKAKIDLLWKIYKSSRTDNLAEFKNYISQNSYWLKDYALYKIIKEKYPSEGWQEWKDSLKYRQKEGLENTENNNFEKMHFHYWMQWQLAEQMKEVKSYAEANDIFLMGDLPFLVSRESADVWAHQNYFRTELSAGAPPDMYFALGQKWGMPPYNWDNIANDGFTYLKEKLKYAENFYNMYRIDHFVGLFRVWTSPVNDEQKASGGSHLPADEHLWESHGRRIIDVMVNSSSMMACAEDLGTVPACSYRVLEEYGIPGMDFQRYSKNNFYFKHPSEYRAISIAVTSTHDSSFWVNWWQFEAGTIDEKLFELMCKTANIEQGHYKYAKSVLFNEKLSNHGRLYWNEDVNSPEFLVNILQPPHDKTNDFVYLYLDSFNEKKKFLSYLEYFNETGELSSVLLYKCLEKINQSHSVFNIQLIQEYLGLDERLLGKISKWSYRINTPARVSRRNWSIILPVSLEELLELDINTPIRDMLTRTDRH